MLESKGGKRVYLCSKCKSHKVFKLVKWGQVNICCENDECCYFGPWKDRLKVSKAEAIDIILRNEIKAQ